MVPEKLPEISNLMPPLVPVEKFCRPFTLTEILYATNNFDDSLIIGAGGFGKVYKDNINDGENSVAIKRLDSASKQGESQFRTEIEMLSKFRHSHIVSLIGYCYTSSEMIVVYEYMINGSLADHLYKTCDKSGGCTLSWVQRLKICLGVARGLDYLHTGTISIVEDGIIHRDVKSSNILLDKNWTAKVSDFGLSKSHPINQSCARTNPRGTFGYMDPEYALTHRLRMKSDVYSFGVVLFEVLCGRRAIDLTLDEGQQILVRWVSRYIEEGKPHQIIDPNLRWEIFPNSLAKFVDIAYQSLCYNAKKRPTITQVVASLELALALQLEKKDSSILEMDIFGNQENVDSTIVQQEVVKFRNYVMPTKSNAFKKMLQQLSLCMACEASGKKIVKVKRTSQQFDSLNKEEITVTKDSKFFDANQNSCLNKDEIMVTKDGKFFDANQNSCLDKEELPTFDNKFAKADKIFRRFDTNRDDCLNTEEMRALVIATNPSVKLTDEHINSLLVEVFQTYSLLIDGEKVLTFSGFLLMYDDGVGDVDLDFATLGFEPEGCI